MFKQESGVAIANLGHTGQEPRKIAVTACELGLGPKRHPKQLEPDPVDQSVK